MSTYTHSQQKSTIITCITNNTQYKKRVLATKKTNKILDKKFQFCNIAKAYNQLQDKYTKKTTTKMHTKTIHINNTTQIKNKYNISVLQFTWTQIYSNTMKTKYLPIQKITHLHINNIQYKSYVVYSIFNNIYKQLKRMLATTNIQKNKQISIEDNIHVANVYYLNIKMKTIYILYSIIQKYCTLYKVRKR
jgi:hypothetical protein